MNGNIGLPTDTLMEKAEFDPVHARLVNDNLGNYHVPVSADIPDIKTLFVDRPALVVLAKSACLALRR
jgi:xanthine dehydrogenase YagR molybdenum-binding subunit